jgi:hypothetical protein
MKKKPSGKLLVGGQLVSNAKLSDLPPKQQGAMMVGMRKPLRPVDPTTTNQTGASTPAQGNQGARVTGYSRMPPREQTDQDETRPSNKDIRDADQRENRDGSDRRRSRKRESERERDQSNKSELQREREIDSEDRRSRPAPGQKMQDIGSASKGDPRNTGREKGFRIDRSQPEGRQKLPVIKINERAGRSRVHGGSAIDSEHQIPGQEEISVAEQSQRAGDDNEDGPFSNLKCTQRVNQAKKRLARDRDQKDAKLKENGQSIGNPTAGAVPAIKKKDLFSPYDLEYANNFLRNTFKMEVIMSLKEQRKQRPAKYQIKNIKKNKAMMRQLHARQHMIEVRWTITQEIEHSPPFRDHEKSSSPDVIADDVSNSGKSYVDEHGKHHHHRHVHHYQESQYNSNALHTNGQSNLSREDLKPNSNYNILGEQPKHMRDPLRFSKPFDLKPMKEQEWTVQKKQNFKTSNRTSTQDYNS